MAAVLRLGYGARVRLFHRAAPQISSDAGLQLVGSAAMRNPGSQAISWTIALAPTAIHAWWTGDEEQVGAFLYGYDSLWLPQSLLEQSTGPCSRKPVRPPAGICGRLHFNKGLAGGAAGSDRAVARHRHQSQSAGRLRLAIIATGGAPRYPGPAARRPIRAGGSAMRRGVDRATPSCGRSRPTRLLRVGKRFLQRQLAGGILGHQLPAAGGGQGEIRSRRPFHRASRRRQRSLERRRFHAPLLTSGSLKAW